MSVFQLLKFRTGKKRHFKMPCFETPCFQTGMRVTVASGQRGQLIVSEQPVVNIFLQKFNQKRVDC